MRIAIGGSLPREHIYTPRISEDMKTAGPELQETSEGIIRATA